MYVYVILDMCDKIKKKRKSVVAVIINNVIYIN